MPPGPYMEVAALFGLYLLLPIVFCALFLYIFGYWVFMGHLVPRKTLIFLGRTLLVPTVFVAFVLLSPFLGFGSVGVAFGLISFSSRRASFWCGMLACLIGAIGLVSFFEGTSIKKFFDIPMDKLVCFLFMFISLAGGCVAIWKNRHYQSVTSWDRARARYLEDANMQ